MRHVKNKIGRDEENLLVFYATLNNRRMHRFANNSDNIFSVVFRKCVQNSIDPIDSIDDIRDRYRIRNGLYVYTNSGSEITLQVT